MLDTLTLFGIGIAVAVIAVLFTICKIRDCNKPVC